MHLGRRLSKQPKCHETRNKWRRLSRHQEYQQQAPQNETKNTCSRYTSSENRQKCDKNSQGRGKRQSKKSNWSFVWDASLNASSSQWKWNCYQGARQSFSVRNYAGWRKIRSISTQSIGLCLITVRPWQRVGVSKRPALWSDLKAHAVENHEWHLCVNARSCGGQGLGRTTSQSTSQQLAINLLSVSIPPVRLSMVVIDMLALPF